MEKESSAFNFQIENVVIYIYIFHLSFLNQLIEIYTYSILFLITIGLFSTQYSMRACMLYERVIKK